MPKSKTAPKSPAKPKEAAVRDKKIDKGKQTADKNKASKSDSGDESKKDHLKRRGPASRTLMKRVAVNALKEVTENRVMFGENLLDLARDIMDDYIHSLAAQAAASARNRGNRTLSTRDCIASFEITAWGSRSFEEQQLVGWLEQCKQDPESGEVKPTAKSLEKEKRKALKDAVSMITSAV